MWYFRLLHCKNIFDNFHTKELSLERRDAPEYLAMKLANLTLIRFLFYVTFDVNIQIADLWKPF